MGETRQTPMLPDEFKSFLESGVSISIATRDADLVPDGTRVWAATVDDDRVHVTAFLTAKTADPIVANLEANKQIALCFDRPSDSRACQLKGIFVGSRRCKPAERVEIERQFEGFLADLATIGVPREVLSGWLRWPAVAIRFKVTEIFKQTPGPGAGERMP